MKIGTRGSELATTQTSTIAAQLKNTLGQDVETRIIQTQGDRVTDRPLLELEGRGYFTKEIEEALLAGTIDLAVHSFKDMPSQSPAGLSIAAVSLREDPADLLIMRPEAHDPAQGKIPVARCAITGTSAVRRENQVCALRPDLIGRDLRGNVPTRVAKLARGQYDAIFLAAAGVHRLHLDLSAFSVVRLDPTWFVPSPGQGALAIQMRSSDPRLPVVRAAVNDPNTSAAVTIERAVQAKFGGGCGLPLGVYAQQVNADWHVYGFWGGDRVYPAWAEVCGEDPGKLVDELYRALKKGRSCTIES